MTQNINPNNMTFGFIGLGLIGGSMAKAIRSTYPACKILAYNRSEEARVLAYNEGVIDEALDAVDSRLQNCDFIFLCTPVKFNETYLRNLKNIIKETCIITDVGSVKGNIHVAIRKYGLEKNFIGGHPMCGSEKTGYKYSNKAMCQGAKYPITSTEHIDNKYLEIYEQIISEIGFIPVRISPDEHDRVTACISHLPHLVAAELTVLTSTCENNSSYIQNPEKKMMQTLASTGFKDTTRVAASSADVWSQICTENSENIVELLDLYIERLQNLKTALSHKDSEYISNLFIQSKGYRDLFN